MDQARVLVDTGYDRRPETEVRLALQLPHKVALASPICYAPVGTSAMEHHSVRQVGVECGVVDLADDRREFWDSKRCGQLVIEAAGNLDFETTIGSIDDFHRVPPGRASLVHEKLCVAEV